MPERPFAAIVDYGMGNLFSVRQACAKVGLPATITSQPEDLQEAGAVILPGVGAFGDAMASLHALGLVEPLRRAALNGKPFMGICLGLQLLMSESREFGRHRGLEIVEGDVVSLGKPQGKGGALKVPQVGWNRMLPPGEAGPAAWENTPLAGLAAGEYMYFVHSYYVRPADPSLVLSLTQYGDVTFCSSLALGNIFACQFHPERSGPAGLGIYANLARLIAA